MKFKQILAVLLCVLLCPLMLIACTGSGEGVDTGDVSKEPPAPHAKDDPIYYVAPDGDDSNPGTAEAPFATIEGARNALRPIIAEGLTMALTVKIEAGTYYFDHCIEFDAQDSGTAEFPITYEAVGDVIFTGGVTLDGAGFTAITEEEKARLSGDAANKVVCFDLTTIGLSKDDWGPLSAIGTYSTAYKYDDAAGSAMWSEVFVNDQRQTLARYPNEGYLMTTNPVLEGECLLPLTRPQTLTDADWNALRNPAGDINGIDAETAARAASWATLNDVWMFGYPRFDWADMSSPVTAIDTTNNSMSTKYVSIYGLRSEAPYYFYNVFEEIDIPGEWYLDRETGKLYLYPSTDLSSAEVMFSLFTDNMIRSNGTNHFVLNGISFSGVRNTAMIMYGDYVSVVNCEVKNVTGNAMQLVGNNNYIANNEMHHLGSGGIVVDGGDRATLTPSGTIIENNHIHHFGELNRTYSPGLSVPGCGHIVRNNELHDAPHMAIGFGGNENIFEYNELYNVCQEADDSGAIYGGKDYSAQGNVFRYNYFHDIYSIADSNAGVFAIYCDDAMGGSIVEHNIFRNVHTAQMYHGGHNMIFRENLIIDAPEKSEWSIRLLSYVDVDDLRPGQGGVHEANLSKVPYTGELWTERYPQIQEYLTWKPKEQSYPHYCDISNNIIINHRPIDTNFTWDKAERGNRMDNNVFLDVSPESDLAKLVGEVLPAQYETFTSIDFSKIGRNK